jgi:hypothetical protein
MSTPQARDDICIWVQLRKPVSTTYLGKIMERDYGTKGGFKVSWTIYLKEFQGCFEHAVVFCWLV